MSHNNLCIPREAFPENPTILAMSTGLKPDRYISSHATERTETAHTLSLLYPDGAVLFTGAEASGMYDTATDHNLPKLGRGTYINENSVTPSQVVSENQTLFNESRGIIVVEHGPKLWEIAFLAKIALTGSVILQSKPFGQINPREYAKDLSSYINTRRLSRGAKSVEEIDQFRREHAEASLKNKLSARFS
jgi:hypothetical protein